MLVMSRGSLTSVSKKNGLDNLKGLTCVQRVSLSHRISCRCGPLSSCWMSVHMKRKNLTYLRPHLHQKTMQCERRGYEEQEYMLRAQCPCCKYLGGLPLAGSPGSTPMGAWCVLCTFLENTFQGRFI